MNKGKLFAGQDTAGLVLIFIVVELFVTPSSVTMKDRREGDLGPRLLY